MHETREGNAPTDDPVEPVDGYGAAIAERPRVRWIAAGRVEEIDFRPEGGPRLIPCPSARHAERLTALLLEALDRAAGGADRVRVSKDGWEVFLDRPRSWPTPGRPLSAAITGGPGEPSARDQAAGGSSNDRAVLDRAGALDPADRQLLTEYAERHRLLTERREHIQSALARAASARRRHAGIARAWTLLCAAGLTTALAGAAIGPLWLLVTGAAGFCVGAGGTTVERLALPAAERRESRLKERLRHVCDEADSFGRRSRSAARSLGFDEPAEASRCLGQAEAAAAERRTIAPAVAARLRSFAARVGIDPEPILHDPGLEDPASSQEPVLRHGLATARFLERVQRELPAPWPVVIRDPWDGLPADEQAAWLMALAEEVSPRAVLAVISSGGR